MLNTDSGKKGRRASSTFNWRGRQLSRLSLGTAQLGLDYGVANFSGKPAPNRAAEIIRAALSQGIDFFDTAQGYGDSEEALGAALADAGAQTQAVVATKIDPGLAHAGRDLLRAAVEKSLAALGVSQLFGLLLHREEWLADWSYYHPILKDMQADGLVAHLGVSVYTETQAEAALATDGIDVIQLPFNLFDRWAVERDWFARAAAAGKLIAVRSLFLQGLLLLDVDQVPAHMAFAVTGLKRFRRACETAGLSPKEACMGFAVAMAENAVIIFGAEKPGQVEEMAAIAAGWAGRAFPYDKFADLGRDADRRLISPSLWPKGGSDE